jgi:hypothetical protein
MRWLYCWRCRREMPMLNEEEFAVVLAMYRDALRLHKQVEEQHDHPRRGGTLEEIYEPCLDAYERLTGFRESNPNAVMHHRLAIYGHPCRVCGKPLRTPQASKCMACGAGCHAFAAPE